MRTCAPASDDDTSNPDSVDNGDNKAEESIVSNGQFNCHDLTSFPDCRTPKPYAYDDAITRPFTEFRMLSAECIFDLARMHLAVRNIIEHGERGANGTIRYVCWHEKDYDCTPKHTLEGSGVGRRFLKGTDTYRTIEQKYGIDRSTAQRAFEHFVAEVQPLVEDGVLGRISATVMRQTPDVDDLDHQTDWLEELGSDMRALHDCIVARCPSTRTGRDPVRAMAYALVANGHVRNDLAQSFCFPHGTDSSVLIKEYVALSSIVGAHRLSRIMRMLADTFA